MNRRSFLATAGAAAASSLLPGQLHAGSGAVEIYVSPNGDDGNDGTFARPLRSLPAALAEARHRRSRERVPILILLRGGTYELAETIVLTEADAADADAPLSISGYANEHAVLSGGTKLQLAWKPYRGQIFQAAVPPGTTTDQLFVNGERQTLARYPNFDPVAQYLGGTAADSISHERAARWANPAGGFINAMQESLWGSLHYRIEGKDAAGNLKYEGGWQVDRDQPMHGQYRFVEGIFEELDAPGEWFLDEKNAMLYYYPFAGLKVETATVEIVRLKHLLELRGTESAPLRGLRLANLTFCCTLRTFMETRESLLRSDWRIYRGGALLLENTEEVTVDRCFFDQLGGNAAFVSGANRHVQFTECRIDRAGASGICFVGRPEAVRNALSTYSATQTLAAIDRTPGPKSRAFPTDCLVSDCLITATGRFEKQTAPIEIAMAMSVTVEHCSIYGVPRAGINIGDGAWGGHRIAFCDVFDTVLETSDHGAFNSWGRDRWWNLAGADQDALMAGPLRDLPTLEATLPTTLTNSRWACEHGWDIDLDDGSTNYRIENNLCLCGGIKLREGYLRQVRNNITVNNSLHVHVWPSDSEDIFRSNVVFLPYRPIATRGWGSDFDLNFLHRPGQSLGPAKALAALSGQDVHSLTGNAMLVDPQRGDFSVSPASPALTVGFVNFPMDRFGVRSPALRALAKAPDIARLLAEEPSTIHVEPGAPAFWHGALVRNLSGPAEVSSLGAPGLTGVLVAFVLPKSPAELAGLKINDLLLAVDGQRLENLQALQRISEEWLYGHSAVLSILREQKPMKVTIVAAP
jgi:hypothetical protein